MELPRHDHHGIRRQHLGTGNVHILWRFQRKCRTWVAANTELWVGNVADENIEERYDHVNGPNTTAAIILDFVVDKPITSCWFNIRFDKPDSAVGANSVNFQYNSTEGERVRQVQILI